MRECLEHLHRRTWASSAARAWRDSIVCSEIRSVLNASTAPIQTASDPNEPSTNLEQGDGLLATAQRDGGGYARCVLVDTTVLPIAADEHDALVTSDDDCWASFVEAYCELVRRRKALEVLVKCLDDVDGHACSAVDVAAYCRAVAAV